MSKTKRLTDQLKEYHFECEAGPLENCVDYQELVIRVERYDGILDLTKALVDKMDTVHESLEYRAVWEYAWVNGLVYKGEKYDKELEVLREALRDTEP